MSNHVPKLEPSGAIALIEAHDGRVSSVVISTTESSRIEFDHLAVYHQCGPEEFKVWSYRAVLEANGVHRVIVEGEAEATDYIDEGVVLFGEEQVDWKALLDSRPVTHIKLVFGSGRTIDMDCHEAQLRLTDANKALEDWIGPLYSSPST